jgi:hypothetical protein
LAGDLLSTALVLQQHLSPSSIDLFLPAFCFPLSSLIPSCRSARRRLPCVTIRLVAISACCSSCCHQSSFRSPNRCLNLTLVTAMVYITSTIFDSNVRHDRPASPPTMHTQNWGTMVDTHSTPSLGKRKRRADSDEDGLKFQYSLPYSSLLDKEANMANCSGHSTQHRSSPASKGVLKLHAYGYPAEQSTSRMYPVSAAASACITSESRPTKQMRRTNPKIALVKSASHLMDTESDPAPSSNTNSNSDLRPCHACMTAPKRRRDLENYMDCKRCVERACYICARECVGCEKAICKKCIVEVGEEGDSWCLDCYSKRINS